MRAGRSRLLSFVAEYFFCEIGESGPSDSMAMDFRCSGSWMRSGTTTGGSGEAAGADKVVAVEAGAVWESGRLIFKFLFWDWFRNHFDLHRGFGRGDVTHGKDVSPSSSISAHAGRAV